MVVEERNENPDLVLDDKTQKGFIAWFKSLPQVRRRLGRAMGDPCRPLGPLGRAPRRASPCVGRRMLAKTGAPALRPPGWQRHPHLRPQGVRRWCDSCLAALRCAVPPSAAPTARRSRATCSQLNCRALPAGLLLHARRQRALRGAPVLPHHRRGQDSGQGGRAGRHAARRDLQPQHARVCAARAAAAGGGRGRAACSPGAACGGRRRRGRCRRSSRRPPPARAPPQTCPPLPSPCPPAARRPQHRAVRGIWCHLAPGQVGYQQQLRPAAAPSRRQPVAAPCGLLAPPPCPTACRATADEPHRCCRSASPGKLSAFEEELYGRGEVAEVPLVLAVSLGYVEGARQVGRRCACFGATAWRPRLQQPAAGRRRAGAAAAAAVAVAVAQGPAAGSAAARLTSQLTTHTTHTTRPAPPAGGCGVRGRRHAPHGRLRVWRRRAPVRAGDGGGAAGRARGGHRQGGLPLGLPGWLAAGRCWG